MFDEDEISELEEDMSDMGESYDFSSQGGRATSGRGR